MKTNHITLRENEALTALSVYSAKTIDQLRNKIMTGLIESNILYDSDEFAGETLQYIFQQNDRTTEQFAVYHFNVSSPRITTLLNRLQIWGVENDCENCGCQMFETEDEIECENSLCGCSINLVPDPDSYRDDRLHSELIEIIITDHKN